MNPYFSRLAQRSSVSAAVPHKQPRAASAGVANDAWGEQNLEITAPGNSQAQEHHAANSDAKTATDLSSLGSHRVTTTPENSTNIVGSTIVGSQTISPQGNSVEINQASSFSSATALPKTLYSDSHLLVSKDDSPSTMDKPEKTTSRLAPDSHTVSQASVISTDDDSYAESSARTSTEYTPRIKSFSRVQADTNAVFESTKDNKKTSISETVESFDEQRVQRSQQNRARAITSTSVIDQSNQSERVASNPIQATQSSLQPIRTALHSSVQVYIGKIELEVFAPTAKPTPAPPPRQAAISKPSPGSRSAVFNPHRHYLRGR